MQNFSPEAANLWFASLTKQSFVWRQNFVQTFGLQAEGGKTTFCKPYKAYKAKLCTSFVRRLQGLQSFACFARHLRSKGLLWYPFVPRRFWTTFGSGKPSVLEG
ncbi:hypothetical protein EON73_00585 [bacterium]|nr:MAG: hypothetical protein EON73_00585 [bacterium]